MWTATLALSGLIGAGVPQDWATHDRPRADRALRHRPCAHLAIVLPQVMQARREAKREKLLQYARASGRSPGAATMNALTRPLPARAQFSKVSASRRACRRTNWARQRAVDAVVKALTEHGMVKLGEQRAITPEVSRAILEAAL